MKIDKKKTIAERYMKKEEGKMKYIKKTKG